MINMAAQHVAARGMYEYISYIWTARHTALAKMSCNLTSKRSNGKSYKFSVCSGVSVSESGMECSYLDASYGSK